MKTDRDQHAWQMRVLKRRHSLLRQHGIIQEHTGLPTETELERMNTKYGKEYLNFLSDISNYMKYTDTMIPCYEGTCQLGDVMVRAVTKECLKLHETDLLLKGRVPDKDSILFELLEGKHALSAHKEIYADNHTAGIHNIHMCGNSNYAYNVFVVTINEIPMGVFSIEMKADHRLYRNNTYIIPEFRGNGLYEICLKACIEYCQHVNAVLDNKVHEFYFVCKLDNVAVYKKAMQMGFQTRANGDSEYPLQVFKPL